MPKDNPDMQYPSAAEQLLPAATPPAHQSMARGAPEFCGFDSHLCACASDPDTCCIAFCCPCHAHGLLCQDPDGRHYSPHCLTWLLLCFMFPSGLPPVLLGAAARARVREKYGLSGSLAEDFLIHFFCNPCSIAQELRFLKSRGHLRRTARSDNPYSQSPVGDRSRI